jgi:hypothetical protein
MGFMSMKKRRSQNAIHVEPKDMPRYGELPQAARDALVDALLILIARGRQVLASQGTNPKRGASDDQPGRRDG